MQKPYLKVQQKANTDNILTTFNNKAGSPFLEVSLPAIYK